MAQHIPLTQGYFAIVDADDYERISKHKWCVGKSANRLYAKRLYKGKTIRMHQVIADCTIGNVIDHINGDGLDNRKNNLRVCTQSDNMKNIKMRKNNISGVRGVHWDKNAKKWFCQVQNNGKKTYLGLYKNLEQAKEVVLSHHKLISEFYQTR